MEDSTTDARYMRQALAQAQAASARGEVPIGAVLVDPQSGKVIAGAGNSPIARCDPTAHAEILCLRAAGEALKNYRLGGLVLYVTLEPCVMCAGAIANARVGRLVYGASDPKGGAVESGVRFFKQPTCHHKLEVSSGVLADESAALLKAFFRAKRGRA